MSEIQQRRDRMAKARKDFEVSYRFFSPEEGGRSIPASQGYRSDWSYEGDDIQKLYMIWPIFLDEKADIIEPDECVPSEGVAQMFILNDEFRAFHAVRLEPGTRGYFMEGPHRVAEATVIKLLAITEDSVPLGTR